jgi:hypothetical protein
MLSTNGFRRYRRKQIAELRPYELGETLEGVSVGVEDRKAGSPKKGDMIAGTQRTTQISGWSAQKYFADNFEPA